MALGVLKVIVLLWVIVVTRLVALMIQLGKFVGGGVVVGWLTPTTYIQLAGLDHSVANMKIFIIYEYQCLKYF